MNRWHGMAAGAGAVLVLGLLVRACFLDPDVPFLVGGPRAPWIGEPVPVTTFAILGTGENRTLRFSRTFEVDRVTGRAKLEARALRALRVRVNGTDLPAEAPGEEDWRRTLRWDLSPFVRSGTNRIEIGVRNSRGPSLLQARLDLGEDTLVTDGAWRVRRGSGDEVGAEIADDTRPLPDARALPPAPGVLASLWPVVTLSFVVSVLVVLGGRLLVPASWRGKIPLAVFLSVSAAWLVLVTRKALAIPLETGFDSWAHVQYVAFLLEHGRLPWANEGWEAYQPPLYYLLAAAISAATAEGISPLVKVVGVVCGLGNVAVAFGLARRVFGDDTLRVTIAVIFAALTPMNLYMSVYVSNEPLHAFLAGLGILVVARISGAERVRLSHAVGAGVVFGLALLAKMTALTLLPAACLAIVLTLACGEGSRVLRMLSGGAGFVGGALAVGGWPFLRNAARFGSPLVGNWHVFFWWQQPGFHTPRYYLGFGESLVHPFYSGFRSFWDALYSTFWGDGYLAGEGLVSERHGFWNWEAMSVSYVLAAPATALLLYGTLRAVRFAFGDHDPGRRRVAFFLLASVGSAGFAVLFMSLRLPFYGQAKAFYALCLVGPVAILGAFGIGDAARWLGRRVAHLDLALYGLLGAHAAAILAAFL